MILFVWGPVVFHFWAPAMSRATMAAFTEQSPAKEREMPDIIFRYHVLWRIENSNQEH